MKGRSFFVVIVSVVLLSAFGGEGNIQLSDEFKAYKINIGAAEVDFVGLVDKVEVMRLEETDQSLLSNISLFLESNQEYFLGGYSNGGMRFHRYAKTGKFISGFDRTGDGPEEYRYPNMLWVQDETVFVHLKYKKRIKQYRLNGEFLKVLELPYIADQVLPLEDGYALDMNHSMLDSLKFDVLVYDQNFNITAKHIPYQDGYDGFSMSSDANGFLPYKNGHTYIRTLSDSLFFLEKGQMKPLAKFDFGKAWLWNTGATEPGFERALKGAPPVVSSMSVFTHTDWFYLTCNTNHGIDHLVVNRVTGESHKLDFKTADGEKFFPTILRAEKDRLLVSLSSEYVGGFLNQLDEKQYTFTNGTTLEKIESSENPVMMWVKFTTDFP